MRTPLLRVGIAAVVVVGGLVAVPDAGSMAVPSSGPAGTTFQAQNTVGVNPGMNGVNGVVTLEDSGGGVIASGNEDPVVDCKFNVSLTVPAGTPPGVYNLRFKDEVGCPPLAGPTGVIDGTFTVTPPVVPVTPTTPKHPQHGGSGGTSGGGSTGAGPPVTTSTSTTTTPGTVTSAPTSRKRAAAVGAAGHRGTGHAPKTGGGPPTASKRSGFSASLTAPADIPFSLASLARSGLLALLLAMLISLPVTIFNESTDESFLTFSGRFLVLRRFLDFAKTAVPGAAAIGTLIASIVLGAAITVFLQPGFPTEPGAGSFVLGILVGVAVVTGSSWGTWTLYVRQRAPDAGGAWLVFGPFVAISIVLVVFSRLLGFLPGLVLGTLADYKTDKSLSVKQKGQRVALTAAAGLALGLAAWFAWAALDPTASKPGASFGITTLDTALALVFAAGVQGFVFGLVPVRFLNGHSLYTWNRRLWLAMWAFGLFWFVHLIVQPALGTNKAGAGSKLAWAAALLAVTSILAAIAWWYTNRGRRQKKHESVDL